MQSLDERLTELRAKAAAHAADAAMCRRKAGDFEHEAMVIEAEIRGIEAALAVFQPSRGSTIIMPGNGAEPPRQRRERRDIKALVRAELSEPRPEGSQPSPEAIALRIGCRASQVRKALEALRRDRDLEG